MSEPKPNRPKYNEFGKEAGSRTGPLQRFHQRSGKIVREQDRQRHRGGVKVCPRASSKDEFFFSSSNTTKLELSGVFRIAIPPFRWLLLLFISLFRSSSSYTCQSSRPILECTSPQPFFLRSVSSCGPHRAVQGSHPYQRGQSVSCVYLIRR